MSFRKENIFVRAGDVFSIQHDTSPGSFLQCHGNASSRHRGSSSGRADSSGCSVRVLYSEEQLVPLLSPHNAGLEQPGPYTVRASVASGLFSANLSCSFRVASPVSGLRLLHPSPQGSRLYLPSNHTSLLLKLSSGLNATARCLGDNHTVPFVASCPPALAPLCARDTNDTWFAVVQLRGLGEGVSTHTLIAENSVSSQNITVTVKVEEPIRGLRATPDPESRVLVNTRVVSVCCCSEPVPRQLSRALWLSGCVWLGAEGQGSTACCSAARLCCPRCCRHSIGTSAAVPLQEGSSALPLEPPR